MDWNQIEKKWQQRWKQAKIFQADPPPKNKRKAKHSKGKLFTFPYAYMNGPLHIGHALTCLRVDIYARFKRMQGYNVLFPFAFHYTGEPLVGVAKRIAEGDQKQIEILVRSGVPREEISKFTDPKYIGDYYRAEAIETVDRIGFSVDWRRQFTTVDPPYNKFIEWQYWTLRDKGYVVLGSHPVVWCPRCLSPTGDHDRLVGEGVSPIEYTLLKFECDGAFLMAATLRPETVFGVTNMWLNPDAVYVRARVDGEVWIVSREAVQKLRDQLHVVEVLEEFEGRRLIGKFCRNVVVGSEVPILPASFVDPGNASGVVMSVPSHAPFDWAAIADLRRNPEVLREYGIDPSIVMGLEPISLIETEGFGEHPAVDLVEAAGIKSQKDKRLEDITKEVYRREFHKGILKKVTGRYAGRGVAEVKKELIADFVSEGKASSLWETAEPVVCRCNTRTIVKILENQWFLKYSDPEWKARVRELLERMIIVPDEARSAFEYTVDWLEDKACVRRSGLGTRLPWDPDWIVETLSDSTVYMAFYTVAKHIYGLGIPAEKLTREVFDYIFLGKGNVEEVAGRSGLDEELLEDMRDEFEYWYPVSLRNSAKELIFNHLTFFLFQHVAIWPEDKWPRMVGANGMIQIEGQKMSKSRGIFITLKEALDQYNADPTRFELAYSAEGLVDPDWRAQEVVSLRRRLELLYDFATNLPETKPLDRDIDRWLLSRVHRHIKAATEYYEVMRNRSALQEGFFDLWNDIRWYMRRTEEYSDVLRKAVETMILLVSPVTPHICEEIWERIGHKRFIVQEPWPTYDEKYFDEELELREKLISDTIEDIKEILKVTRIEKPSKITLFVAQSWKYKILAESLKNREDLIKRVMADAEVKKQGKDAVNYAQKLLKNPRHEMLTQEIEFQTLSEAAEFLAKEFGAKVEVLRAEESKHEKARMAEPLKPGVLIET
ncbi:MAG: leucine--tRNA ligase [Candidatus Freyarchaeota archaeon]|nr:leucine--tRNA ligase [Candidatus Jordarchaeia archaeon]MBS7279742.1 leucine--tRNA ligase [Candidatus Jordarchaeia archaeon]